MRATFGRNLIALIVLLILASILPIIVRFDRFTLTVITTIFIWAMLASSWNIIGGFGGQLSLGHGAFFGIGAYTSTILLLEYGISPWLGMIVGGVLAGLFGLAIGYPAFRLKGYTFAMITLISSLILQLIFNYFGFLGGAYGFAIPATTSSWESLQFGNPTPYYYVFLAFMVGTALFVWRIARSKLGYFLEAIREDQDAAESLGVNSTRVKLQAMFISAFLSAIAGTLYTQFTLYVAPDLVYGFFVNNQIVLLTIIGGIGTIWGPIIGSAIGTAAGDVLIVLVGNIPAMQPLIYGVVLIIVIVFEPTGVVGLAKKIGRSKFFSSIYKRERSEVGLAQISPNAIQTLFRTLMNYRGREKTQRGK